jgi:hypothetical protein
VNQTGGSCNIIDVGTNISGQTASMHNDQLELFVHAEMSNFAIPEQAKDTTPDPVIRQLKIGGSTLAVLGKADGNRQRGRSELEAAVSG